MSTSGRKKILITGASGQLGGALVTELRQRHEVLTPAHGELDITRRESVKDALESIHPDVLINAVGYNDVDGAEAESLRALEVNAFAVRWLSKAAALVDATFVHYGSDFVFDGRANHPYSEEDEPEPKSVYGASKLLGEWFARRVKKHYVLRVESLFGGERRKSTIDRIVEALEEGRRVRAFADRIVSPSYVPDIVAATVFLVEKEARYGLYHCVSSGHAPWLELAQEAARLLDVSGKVDPVSVDDVPLKAARPRYAALANGKLAAEGFLMPHWRDALRRYVASRESSREMKAVKANALL